MNWLFNLLYWSTFGTKGTRCCAAGRRRAQVMQFQAVSAQSPVPRNRHHDWPHSALTQQPQRPEESRQSSDEARKKCSPHCPRRKRYLWPKDWWIQASPTLPLQLEKTISHDLLLCLHLWSGLFFFFQGSAGERQGSCTKAGNIEEEMKMSGAEVTDVGTGELEYTVPCKTFPSILAIFSVVTPGREMHKLAFPFSSDLFGIQHTYLSKCCVCHAVLR